MPYPGITRPDLCSIHAAAGQAELAGTVRGGLGADGHSSAGDDPSAPRRAAGYGRQRLTGKRVRILPGRPGDVARLCSDRMPGTRQTRPQIMGPNGT